MFHLQRGEDTTNLARDHRNILLDLIANLPPAKVVLNVPKTQAQMQEDVELREQNRIEISHQLKSLQDAEETHGFLLRDIAVHTPCRNMAFVCLSVRPSVSLPVCAF